jgi:protein-S-isoprenylcysteine O-methyltransferase Ste14
LKASLGQILFRTRGVIATLWVLLLFVFSHPWISVWSGLLFLPGLAIRFWAAGFIGPQSRKPDISTDSLTTSGPYALFRHPLYIANALLVAAGLALLRPHWILTVLTGLGFVILYVFIARAEESRLLKTHGKEYEEYHQRVTPFFPRRLEGSLFAGFKPSWAFREWQTWVVVGLLYLVAFLRATVIERLIELTAEHLGWIASAGPALLKALLRLLLLAF